MKIITFYSFKGGVGRTALLTNLGVHWASEGKVVALMDLDLAAPGLSYSPLLGEYLDPRGAGLGMADLFNVFRRGLEDPDNIRLLPPRYLLREMKLPPGYAPNGRLLAIGVGEALYQAPALDADEHAAIPGPEPLPGEGPDQAAFRALAQHLKADLAEWRVPEGGPAAGRGIDYLLIDARTGYSELRDLSLGYLADHIVLVSGLNQQNLHGLELTLDALTRLRIPPGELALRLSVVFSPVPVGEDDAVLQALEQGTRILTGFLRPTRGGQRELSPNNFTLHYTPQLATSDIPPLLKRRRALYAREVLAIAKSFETGSMDTNEQDDLLIAARQKVLRLTQPPAPLPAFSETGVNPLAELPDWRWPFDPDAQAEASAAFAARLAPPAEVAVDRDRFLTLLAWSISLSPEEKGHIVDASGQLSQSQFDQLLEIFEEERRKFMQLWEQPSNDTIRPQLLGLYFQHGQKWAQLLLGEATAARQRLARQLLAGHPAFAGWAEQPILLTILAADLLQSGDDNEAIQALQQALALGAEPDHLLKIALEKEDGLPPSRWAQLLPALREALGDLPRLYLLEARSLLPGAPEERQRAAELLRPLLHTPPEEADLCFDLAAFALDRLPEVAPEAEPALRAAIEQQPEKANYWNSLGYLLTDHLQRHDEAEAAYRRAIELDAKYAYPWNGLGNVLAHHLLRYDEAEAAYRRAIELDAKLATPWIDLGNLLAGHLQRHDEAEAAYRRAIELDAKNAYLWNSFGLFLLSQGRCTDARTAFQTGLDLDETPEHPYLLMNLGHLTWQLGERQAAEEHLREALSAFADGEDPYGNALRLALELREEAAARRELEKLQGKPEKYVARARLLAALLQDEPQALAEQRHLTLAPLDSYNDLHDLVKAVYLLCGFRPEARAAGRVLVADLLALPPELCERFRDQPKPDALWARYRPFAEGHSEGAGDPADLPLFCRDAAPAA